MKLVRLGESRSKGLAVEYNVRQVDPSFYFNIDFGCIVIYKDADSVYAEHVYEGESEYSPNYIDHVLRDMCRSCRKTRPISITIKTYKPMYEKIFDIGVIALLSFILIIIFMGLTGTGGYLKWH